MVYASTRSRYKKQKPSASERKLREEWERILKDAERGLAKKASSKFKVPEPTKTLSVKFTSPRGPEADLKKHKSLGDQSGKTSLKPSPVYSGDKMLGVATLHKSNGIPVFSNQEILEVCTMRRG